VCVGFVKRRETRSANAAGRLYTEASRSIEPFGGGQCDGCQAGSAVPVINSRNPIITVDTSEEQRFLELVARVADRLTIPLYTCSVTTGLAREGGAALYNSDQPEQALANIALVQGDGIFLLKDFGCYCENDKISRKLRDLADGFRTARRSIILLAAGLSLPPEVSADAVEFQLGLPSADELLIAVRSTLTELSASQGVLNSLDAVGLGQLTKILTGLPEEEALRECDARGRNQCDPRLGKEPRGACRLISIRDSLRVGTIKKARRGGAPGLFVWGRIIFSVRRKTQNRKPYHRRERGATIRARCYPDRTTSRRH
jgi:hypothetical protein